MPFQSPVDKLNPGLQTASPVDRFAKIAQIQSLIEGNQLRRDEMGLRQQEIDIRRQTQEGQLAEQQRKQAAFQRASQIVQAAGGDAKKAIQGLLGDAELAMLAPDYIKALQGTIEKEDAGFTLNPGDSRYDASGKLIVSAPAKEPTPQTPADFTLGPGQQRFSPDGTPIASVPVNAASQSVNNDTVTTNDGVFQWNPGTNRYDIRIGPRPKNEPNQTLSATGESNVVNRLTQQWDRATKDIKELYRANAIMDSGLAAARKGDMNAGAQAVLITFQKFLDPESVVRESEYARSAEGLAMASRIQGWFERHFSTGGAGVPLAELEAFSKLAREINNRIAAEGNSLLSKEKERIGRNADHFKVPRDLIFSGYDFNIPQGGRTAPAPTSTAAPTGAIREQVSPSTGQYRHSTDGGKTWKPGRAPK